MSVVAPTPEEGRVDTQMFVLSLMPRKSVLNTISTFPLPCFKIQPSVSDGEWSIFTTPMNDEMRMNLKIEFFSKIKTALLVRFGFQSFCFRLIIFFMLSTEFCARRRQTEVRNRAS